ncbi:MAG TPA: DMT family transporter [Bacteroidales bacterium]|jgi:drug/metabolite transporter (DMT)-like permease|nr:DMT family transporter [Bacteroidales bacterium]NLH32879.1 DMT family transporter [Lentimicrobium sp.]OQC38510.1 MAG: EamA-like transporter family protein [Bacteroidetes bacterium ADurb.Bin041]MBP7873816.1 DMT family transporter [Bacteroidales bacterium]MCZ2283365.1 DMT family transporter [Bacteroidales bacterium]
MNLTKSLKAHLSLLLAAMIFGANYWISKGLMPDYLSPEQLLFLRVVGSFLLFFMISFMLPSEKVDKADKKTIALASLLGVTLNQLLFFIGLNLSTPVDVAIIHVSNPIFVLIIASFLLRENVTFLKIIGIGMGAAGAVLLITYQGELSFSSNTFTGNLMALLNTLAYSFYLIIIKPIMKKYSPITVMKWAFLYGTIFSLPLTLHSAIDISFEGFTINTWFSLFFVIVLTTFMAYLLTIYGLKYLDAGVVSYYVYLQPIIVTGIAYFISSNPLSWQHIIAASLIFGGVWLVSLKNPRLTTPLIFKNR